jgi:hypothetical protein
MIVHILTSPCHAKSCGLVDRIVIRNGSRIVSSPEKTDVDMWFQLKGSSEWYHINGNYTWNLKDETNTSIVFGSSCSPATDEDVARMAKALGVDAPDERD